ncbi:MAG TPA: zinc-dependent alcohol dehydrogenase [Opitutaceae bacterium]|nr:zinc-dependent alcohol dehydrogenase [Opitutaceae bacterium]
MKAVVFHGVGDIRLENVPEPRIEAENDAIVRLTASAICGTDLHFVRGTIAGMVPGTILGHEGVGIVEEVGKGVRNFHPGDRVVIPSTIGCGSCSYCRAGYFAQCDQANPNGSRAGTAFFGGPKESGPFHGLQAEFARIPFANVGLVKLPGSVTDEQAILLSDIFPTGYFGAELAEIKPGDTVAVFGCGPVGQFAIASAKLKGAGRILAVDTEPTRLVMARDQGAEAIDFNREDPVEAIHALTLGIGVDRAIDAVGIDANRPSRGPAADKAAPEEQAVGAAPAARKGRNWIPGSGPSQVLSWAVEALAKAGSLGIIGVYPPTARAFPIGKAMNKNLSINLGNCNHRKYLSDLVNWVRNGTVDPLTVLTQHEPITSAIEAYEAFDRREPGWIKVELQPSGPHYGRVRKADGSIEAPGEGRPRRAVSVA